MITDLRRSVYRMIGGISGFNFNSSPQAAMEQLQNIIQQASHGVNTQELSNDPLFGTMFGDMNKMREAGMKLDAFEKEKQRELTQARDFSEAKMKASRDDFYDKELEGKLEAFSKNNSPSDPDYEKKKQSLMTEHQHSVRTRELKLIKNKQDMEDNVTKLEAKANEDFAASVRAAMDPSKTPEERKALMDTAGKNLQASLQKAYIDDLGTNLENMYKGFDPPYDSTVLNSARESAQDIKNIINNYELPNGSAATNEVKDAYNYIEAQKQKMAQNMEQMMSPDMNWDQMFENSQKKLNEMFKNVPNLDAQMDNLNNMSNLGNMDLNQFKFDQASFDQTMEKNFGELKTAYEGFQNNNMGMFDNVMNQNAQNLKAMYEKYNIPYNG